MEQCREGGHAGGQLDYWLLLEQEGVGRQMLALQGGYLGGQQPVVCAGPLQQRHGGGDDDLQELVSRLQGLVVL